MGLGHEGSGAVTQVGKEVTHVEVGDHVITTRIEDARVALEEGQILGRAIIEI